MPLRDGADEATRGALTEASFAGGPPHDGTNRGGHPAATEQYWIIHIEALLGLFIQEKNLFSIMQLSPEFNFGHATSKPDMLNHQTIKTVYI